MFAFRCALAVLFPLGLVLTLSVGGLRDTVYGSDELENYTAKYTWLANQMSHAMMGFFGMTVFWLFWVSGRSRWWALVPFGLVMAKDFLLDTGKDALSARGSPVPIEWGPVLFDSLTDDLFWFSGFALALLIATFDRPAPGPSVSRADRFPRALWPVALLVSLALAVGCGGYWVAQKDSFDRSGLPLNYTRLAHLAGRVPFPESAKEKGQCHLRTIQKRAVEGRPAHVFIHGGTPQERNALAVSIGCEYAFRLPDGAPWGWTGPTTVVHTTAARLLEGPNREVPDAEHLRCVVIADLDTALSPPPDVLIDAAIKRDRPDLISGGVRNQLDLTTFFNNTEQPRLEYKRDTLLTMDDIRLLKSGYQEGKILNSLNELRLAVTQRAEPFKRAAARARGRNAATVWTLAETPSWLGGQCPPEVEARHRKADRDAWVLTLTDLLGLKDDEVFILELNTP